MTPFTKTIKSGMHLFREHDRSRELYLIQSGSVTVYRTAGGREVELATLEKGSVLGEMALIDGKPRSASAKAREDCTVIIIDAGTFHNKIKGVPSWFMSIIRSTCQKIRQANRRLQSISSEHQSAHIIMVINLYYRRFATAEKGIPLSSLQHHLIRLLGVTNLIITAVLDFLCEHTFISLSDSRVFCHDSKYLDEYCEYLRFLIRKQYDSIDPSNDQLHRCATLIIEHFPDILLNENGNTVIEGECFYQMLQHDNLDSAYLDLIEDLETIGCCSRIQKPRPAKKGPLEDCRMKLNHLACKRIFLFYKYHALTPGCL